LKLNLGCGFDRREGWLNVDNFGECQPDRLLDLEQTPWDLPSDAFDEILLKHVLEHVGADFATFAAVMRELHRVAAPDAIVEIHVPHVRSDTFWSDPTHVRAFTPLTFRMMSKRQNREWMARRGNYTMLAMLMDVDFELESAIQVYDPAWWAKVQSGELTQDDLRQLADERWNVVRELQVKLRAVKG
jgi:predicted SAM-dependent methyltransferase